RVIMFACMPSRHFLCFPGFDRTHTDGLRRHQSYVAPTGSARVLSNGQRVQVHHAGRQLPIFGGRWRLVFVFSHAWKWIVESPMLHVLMPSLHYDASRAGILTFAVG